MLTRSKSPSPAATVFIGSSSEAQERGILGKVCQGLSGQFNLHPWPEVFKNDIFLNELLREATTADGAILIFAKDDERGSRGKQSIVTRDNIHLEFGLFLGTLGLSRLWVLCERGVELPTDMAGLTVSMFDSTNGELLDRTIQTCLTEIKKHWARLPRRLPYDGGTSLGHTLLGQQRTLESTTDRLEEFLWGSSKPSEAAIYIDSNHAARAAYAEALSNVQKRFWTTSYITSGFWARSDAEDVMNANIELLLRLARNHGDVRRIFILDRDPHDKADRRQHELIHMRRTGAHGEIQQLSEELHRIETRMKKLAEMGCQIRVVFDHLLEAPFKYPVHFEPLNTEIAIYDDFRVDFFSGGKIKTITGAQVFTPISSSFATTKGQAIHYFERLWNSDYSSHPEELLKLLKNAHAYAASRIDYRSNWLAKYEYDLDPEDENLKNCELAAVKRALADFRDTNSLITSLIDIGTCSARYPIELYSNVTTEGRIVGIENDPDCLKFAHAQILRRLGSNKKIRLIDSDFTSDIFPLLDLGRFELVTCMLGTLSHFGWDETGGLLALALRRMHDLIEENGLLIIGNWSAYATASRNFLSIYSDQDKDRLVKWTPGAVQIKRQFEDAGLVLLHESKPDERINLFVLTKRGS